MTSGADTRERPTGVKMSLRAAAAGMETRVF